MAKTKVATTADEQLPIIMTDNASRRVNQMANRRPNTYPAQNTEAKIRGPDVPPRWMAAAYVDTQPAKVSSAPTYRK